MSAVLIRAALETALAAITPAIATAFENVSYVPVVGTPYQRVNLLLAEPDAIQMSGGVHREQGFLQVTLCYPLGTGPSTAQARAELIRKAFYRGRSFTSGAVTVTVERHPEIRPSQIDDDRYTLPVRIRFYSIVTRS